MYVGRKRGVGDVIPVPMSTWGYIGSKCDSSSNSGSDGASSLLDNPLALGVGGLILGGVLLYAVFGGGR